MRNSKTLSFVLSSLVVGAASLGARDAAARGPQVHITPFLGLFSDDIVSSFCGPTTICLNVTGHGPALPFGEVDTDFVGGFDLTKTDPTTGCLPDAGTETFILRGGDTLAVEDSGTNCPAPGTTGPAHTISKGRWKVVGGTGRFATAKGEGNYEVDIHTDTATSTGTDHAVYDGLIEY